MADTNLTQLVINVGTTAQIEAGIAGGTITENMLSVSTDGDTYIQGVKVNGTELTPDSNNKVDVTVPTDTGDLTNNAGYITGITSAMVTTALGYSPVNPTSLATVATSGAYSDLSGTPTIPTVNNPTITFTQGGVTKGSFTLNQSTGDTIALDAGSGGSYTAGTGIDITSNVISVTSPTLTNTATGTNSLDLLGYAATTGTQSISIGYHSSTNAGNYSTAVGTGSSCTTSATQSCAFGSSSYAVGSNSTAVGCRARTDNTYSIAVGSGSRSSGDYSIQIGKGTNSEANSVYFATSSSNNWKMLGSDGVIPAGRLNIASSVTSASTNSEMVGAKLFYDTCGDIETLINAL